MKGLIGYYKLETWWTRELTPEERTRVVERFNPMSVGTGEGDTRSRLTEADILSTSRDVIGFFSDLVGWFQKDPDRPIAYKLLAKGESLITSSSPVLDVHFLYMVKVETTYRDAKATPEGRERCIEACRQQIAPAAAEAFRAEYPKSPMVEHTGFTRLAMLHEHAGEYTDSIRVCEQARDQGWVGDWDNRIARCQKRQAKASQGKPG